VLKTLIAERGQLYSKFAVVYHPEEKYLKNRVLGGAGERSFTRRYFLLGGNNYKYLGKYWLIS
jgi:hypothetical protein